ncbi:MAG: DUF2085 domain-containing protein [Anaerolineales bacterium]|jgi:uncharacterized membrane protein/glutaredoxin
MTTVTLYTRPGCEDCLQAEQILREIAARYPHTLLVKDIDTNPRWRAECGEEVPVVEVGGRRLRPPISREALVSALAIALALPDDSGKPARRIERAGDSFARGFTRHWLAAFNVFVFLYVGLPFLAPTLMHLGLEAPAHWIYTIFSPLCHQLGFRSWFLFGERATYPREVFSQFTGIDPNNYWAARAFLGNSRLGYKVAICERDVAIYGSLFLGGLAFGLLRKRLPALPWSLWLLLGILPILLDGGTQLISDLPLGLLPMYESTPFLRTLTGALFGFASVWFAYPMVQASMDETIQAMEKKDTLRSLGRS